MTDRVTGPGPEIKMINADLILQLHQAPVKVIIVNTEGKIGPCHLNIKGEIVGLLVKSVLVDLHFKEIQRGDDHRTLPA